MELSDNRLKQSITSIKNDLIEKYGFVANAKKSLKQNIREQILLKDLHFFKSNKKYVISQYLYQRKNSF